MPRRIPVELTLAARQFLDEARKVETQTAAVDEIMKALGHQVDQTGRDMDKLAVEAALAKKEVKDLGDKSRGTAADLKVLDERIAASKTRVKELGLEFARTGDTIDGKAVGRERSLLGRLEKLRAELTALGSGKTGHGPLEAGVLAEFDTITKEATKSGGTAGRGFLGSFAAVFEGAAGTPVLGPAISGAVIGAIIGLAPVLGATISGAIAGTAGIAGIAGGILAASKNAEVRSAASQFGMDISKEFFASGDAFVQPIRQSLAILEQAFRDMHLDATFAKVAPFVSVLATGVANLAVNFNQGLNVALDRAGPFITVIAQGLSDMGAALGDLLVDATASKGSLEGLKTLFGLLNGTIEALGNTIRWLSDRYADFIQANRELYSFLIKVADVLGVDHSLFSLLLDKLTGLQDVSLGAAAGVTALGNAGAYTADQFDKAKAKIDGAAQAIRDVEAASIAYIDKQLALTDANRALGKAVSDLSEKLIHGKKNWDDTTTAGQKNLDLVHDSIKAARDRLVQEIATSDGSQAAINAANVKYNEELAVILGIAHQAGLTQAALEAMEGTYQIKIVVDTVSRNMLNKASAVDKAINAATGGFQEAIQALRSAGGRAEGGYVAAGQTVWMNERGPELVTFMQPAYVHTAAASAQMAQTTTVNNTFYTLAQDPVLLSKLVSREQSWATGV